MLPLRRRWAVIVATAAGAPISAEFLQAYLSTSGQLVALLGGIVFFAPLYGGAALLIREVAVRTGRGWRCRLWLAAAFGVAMTGVIDLSLFGATRADVPYWAELRGPTAIPALGLSVAPALSWVIGHVVMSIGAPLALLDALAPTQRGRPLLGRLGLVMCSVAFVGVAVLVFRDGRQTYGYLPTWWQITGVLVVVAMLIMVALTARRAVRPAAPRRAVPVGVPIVIGVLGKTALDLAPPTWLGVGITVGLLVAVVGLIGWLDRRRRWGWREIGLLAASVIVTGAALGLTTPTPPGGSAVGKYVQGLAFVVIGLVLLGLVVLGTRSGSGSARRLGSDVPGERADDLGRP